MKSLIVTQKTFLAFHLDIVVLRFINFFKIFLQGFEIVSSLSVVKVS